MGLSPLCTVGAAEFEPPASGRTALFSIAIEFDVFSLALPVVAEGDVVQLVSCFWLDGAVDCAAAGPTTNDATKTTAATRHTMFTPVELKPLPKWNVLARRWFQLPSAARIELSHRPYGARSLVIRSCPRLVLRMVEASEASLAEHHPDQGADEV